MRQLINTTKAYFNLTCLVCKTGFQAIPQVEYMKLFLIKIGGSVITDKDKPNTPNLEVLKRLANEIKNASLNGNAKIVLGHGAGSFGHISAHKYGLKNGLVDENSKKGVAITRHAMHKLTSFVLEAMINAGLNPIAFPPSAGATAEKGKIKNWDTTSMSDALSKGFVPVTNGDVVMDSEMGISIVSGEEALSYLTSKLKPDKIIVAGDLDGVFTADPHVDPEATLIPKIDKNNAETALGGLGPSTHVDVTGGMASKVKYLHNISKTYGIPCQILNANVPGRLQDALMEKDVVSTTISI